jgi:hypothetical protein
LAKKNRPEGRLFQATVDYLEAAGAAAAGAEAAGADAAGAEAAGADAAGAEAAGAAAGAEASAAGAGAAIGAGAGAGATTSSFLLQAAKAIANRDAINSVFFMNISFKDYQNFAMNNYR